MEISIVICQATLHVKIMEQKKFEFVTTTKRENDCFDNNQTEA